MLNLRLQGTLPASSSAAAKPSKSKNRDLADMAEELKKKAKKGEVLPKSFTIYGMSSCISSGRHSDSVHPTLRTAVNPEEYHTYCVYYHTPVSIQASCLCRQKARAGEHAECAGLPGQP